VTNPVTCCVCGDTLKNELVAFSDAKWYRIKDKAICRDCVKEIAEIVISEYA
jgi:hypothetical protein